MKNLIKILMFMVLVGYVNSCQMDYTIDSSNMVLLYFDIHTETGGSTSTCVQQGNITKCCAPSGYNIFLATNTQIIPILPNSFNLTINNFPYAGNYGTNSFITNDTKYPLMVGNLASVPGNTIIDIYNAPYLGTYQLYCFGIASTSTTISTLNKTYSRFVRESGSDTINAYYGSNNGKFYLLGSCTIPNLIAFNHQRLQLGSSYTGVTGDKCVNITKFQTTSIDNIQASMRIIDKNNIGILKCNVSNPTSDIYDTYATFPVFPNSLTTDILGNTNVFTYYPDCYNNPNQGTEYLGVINIKCPNYDEKNMFIDYYSYDSPILTNISITNANASTRCLKTLSIVDINNNPIPYAQLDLMSDSESENIVSADNNGNYIGYFFYEDYQLNIHKDLFIDYNNDAVNFCTQSDNFYTLTSGQNLTYNFYVNITKGNTNINLNNVKVTVYESNTDNAYDDGNLYKFGFASTLGQYNFNISTTQNYVTVTIEYATIFEDIFDYQRVLINPLVHNYYINFDLFSNNLTQCVKTYECKGENIDYTKPIKVNGSIISGSINIPFNNNDTVCWTATDYLTYKANFNSVNYLSNNPSITFFNTNIVDECLIPIFNVNNLCNVTGYIYNFDTRNLITDDTDLSITCGSITKDVYSVNAHYEANNFNCYTSCTITHNYDGIYKEDSFHQLLISGIKRNITLTKINDNGNNTIKYNFLSFHVQEQDLTGVLKNVKDVSIKCNNIDGKVCTTDINGLCDIQKIEQGLTCNMIALKDGYTGTQQQITQFNKEYLIILTNNNNLACILNGNVKTLDSNNNVAFPANVLISVYEGSTLFNTGVTDSNGNYNLAVKCGKSYTVKADYLGNVQQETLSVSNAEGSSSTKNFIFNIKDIENNNKIKGYIDMLWTFMSLIMLIIGIFVFIILFAGLGLLLYTITHLGQKP